MELDFLEIITTLYSPGVSFGRYRFMTGEQFLAIIAPVFIFLMAFALVSVPFVYFLASEATKRYFCAFNGVMVFLSGCFGILVLIFLIVVLAIDFAGSIFGWEQTLFQQVSNNGPIFGVRLSVPQAFGLGIGLIAVAVVLYFFTLINDPGPRKPSARRSGRQKNKSLDSKHPTRISHH